MIARHASILHQSISNHTNHNYLSLWASCNISVVKMQWPSSSVLVKCFSCYLSVAWTCCSTLVCLFLLSVDRQASTNHPPGAGQSDAGSGCHGSVEVPGVRRTHAHHQLAEGWGQSAGQRSAHVPAGAGQPSDQKHTGEPDPATLTHAWGFLKLCVIATLIPRVCLNDKPEKSIFFTFFQVLLKY